MVKSLIKVVVLIVAVVGGGFAGSFVKNMSGGESSEAQAKSEKGDKKSDKDKKDKKGKGDGDKLSSNVLYLKFKRQFVVPVSESGEIKSLIIMNLNIELDKEAPGNSFSYEPKLRDAFMRELLTLSNEGVLSGDLTSPETYEALRETLLGASRRVLKKGVRDILILDLAKRDTP